MDHRKTKSFHLLQTAVLGLALLLTGCGGGGNNSGDDSGSADFTPPFEQQGVIEYLQSNRKIIGRLTGLEGDGKVRLEFTVGDTQDTLTLSKDGGFEFPHSLPVTNKFHISVDDADTGKDCFHADTNSREIRGTVGLADSDLIRIVCTDPLPSPVFKVNRDIDPPRISQVKDEFGNIYPVGRVRFPSGDSAELVTRKALVMTGDTDALSALVSKWNGEILKQLDAPADSGLQNLYMVRFSQPDTPSTVNVAAVFREHAPSMTGLFEASSEDTQETLQFAAEALEAGMKLTLPWILESQDIRSGSTTDAATGTGMRDHEYTPDAFQWPQMQRDGLYRTGVTDAWQAMEFTGNLSSGVDMLIMDGGFKDIGDFRSPRIYNEDVPNPATCGGSDCFWHGTQVASVAAGIIDNGIGVAGVGGPVVRNLTLLGSPEANVLEIAEWLYGIFSELAVKTTIGNGPDIVNISAGVPIPASLTLVTNTIVDPITTYLYFRGVLIVASAGNDSTNVDAEDCFVACWEETTWTPCENAFVFCVGGTSSDRFGPVHPESNYGVNRLSTVDLYAPYRLFTPNLANDGSIGSPEVFLNAGTSFSSPFVAGAAALVLRSLASAAAADFVSLVGFGGVQSVAIEAFLRANANRMWDYDRRSVNVHRAVLSALEATGEDVSARILIETDEESSRISWRRTRPLSLRARHYDPKLSDDPVSLEWRFEDGEVFSTGPGVLVPVSDLEIGSYTVTVTDVAGEERPSASFTFEVANDPPEISLASAIPENICLGAPLSLRALVDDPNWPDGAPAASIIWTATPVGGGATITLGTGERISYSDLSEGEWTIAAQVTDEFGLSDSISGTVAVAACADMPPTIQILSPNDGSSFYSNEDIRFRVVATDPEDGDISSQVNWVTNRYEQHKGQHTYFPEIDSLRLAELIAYGGDHLFATGADTTAQLALTDDGSPHIVRALVTDSGGNQVEAIVVVDIKPVIY